MQKTPCPKEARRGNGLFYFTAYKSTVEEISQGRNLDAGTETKVTEGYYLLAAPSWHAQSAFL